MKVTAKLSSKGQLTLPREVRKQLGVKQGDSVVFEMEDGQITLAVPEEDNPFLAFVGSLPKLPKDTKSFWREMRDGDEAQAIPARHEMPGDKATGDSGE